MKSTLTCLFLALILGCASTTPKDNAARANEGDSNLTATEAQARKARISNVSYNLHVKLTATGARYSGTNEIHFDLTDNSAPLRLDFFEGSVESLNLNGQPLDLQAKKKFWIELPARSLKQGANVVNVTFSQEYSHQGQGLHQFVEPESNDVFLYTQFETFDANRFMPCFDQPDLRATLTMTVDAPAAWQVISTTRELETKSLDSATNQWIFPATPPLATYLFSLHAGPFKVWTDTAGDIPLRLFARPSMAKYVHAADWFRWTKSGLQFYGKYFAYPYPFKKYDQVIVPEFKEAMENVAAVTISEDYLSRSEPTRHQRRIISEVLLHEMAHMWFGDLVTMKWWNDLWLNESFASFMSALAMLDGTEFKESWEHFYSEYKAWAYWEDSLITTHPIEAPINGVKDAFATFDGITYGKGASALKQLWAYMGPAKFQQGLQKYIKANAFKNADRKEFISTLQAETKQDLSVWSERWLRETGTDILAAKWNCEGNKLKSIEFTLTNHAETKLRPQAVDVALFTGAKKPVVVPLMLENAHESITGNWDCPKFVYPNYGDKGFLQVTLDPASLDYVKKNVSSLGDDLLRMQLWHDLWTMVRETQMPLADYIEVINTNFKNERHELILEEIVASILGKQNDRASVLNYWPQETAAEKKSKADFIGTSETQYLQRMHKAKAGSDEQKFWFDSYVAIAQTPEALDTMAKWAFAKRIAPGFTLDLDRRWAIARELSRFQHQDADHIVTALRTEDPTDRGQQGYLASEAIKPSFADKRKWVAMVKQPKPTFSFTEAHTVLTSLFPSEQQEMSKRFADEFYTYLDQNGTSEDENLVESVASSMAPLDCDVRESKRMKDYLGKHEEFTPLVERELKVNLQEDERCQRIRASSKL